MIKSPVPIIMISETTYQDDETCHGLFGMKEPSTTIKKQLDIKCCLMQSEENFQCTCFLHQRSKVLKCFCGAKACRVLRPKVNQIQSEPVASIFILAEGMKFCDTGHIFYLCEDLPISTS